MNSHRLTVLHGAPPSIVWLAGHSLSNAQVVDLLLAAAERIRMFVADRQLALLALG